MMTRMRRGTLALAAVMLTVTACGDDSPSTAPSGVSGKLEVVAKWSGTELENFQRVIDAFKKANPAVEVTYTSGGDDVPAFINQRIAGGRPPEVAMLPQPGAAAELAGKGHLKPLTGEALQALTDNYSKPWQDLGRYSGKPYGIYPKAAYKSPCWYAADAFTAAGVSEPKTWEDFTRVLQTLSDAGKTPLAVPGGSGWTLTDLFENIYIRVGGADRYDKLAKHQIPWTDPTVVESLTLLGSLFSNGKYIGGGNSGAARTDFPQSVADVFGENQKAAILCEGDFVGAELDKLGRYRAGQTAKYFQFPSIKGSPPSAVVGGDQAVALSDNAATMRFMAYLASAEAAELLVKAGGVLSSNKSLDPQRYPNTVAREMANLMNTAEVIKFDLSDLAPSGFGGGNTACEWVLLQDFLTAPGDPAGIAQRLESCANTVTWSS